jgi:protein-S-isoprenylcysteine O-methyltransferase Ste14
MDTVRYYVALFVVAFGPGVFLFWFSIHPFIRFWRRLGAVLTLTLHYAVMLLLAAGIFLARKPLFSIDFGTNPVLVVLAALLLVCAIVLRRQMSRQFGIRLLTGLPELAPATYGKRLVTDGIYARIRHPRYAEMTLSFLACALFSNYLAAYVVFVLSLVWIILVTRVEEKELPARFGDEYAGYCARVPRFIPKV